MRRQRRPQQQAEPSIYQAVDDLVSRGHRQGASLANDYTEVPDLLRRVRECHRPADNSPSQATAREDEQRRLWANLVTVHAWLLRDLLDACRRHAAVPAGARAQEERSSKFKSLAATADSVLEALSEQVERPSAIRARIGLALVRSDSLQCYSQLLVAWPSGIPVERVLVSAHLACGACGRAAVHEVVDAGRTGLFAEWVATLADSQLLEHAARALVRVEEEVTESPRGDRIQSRIRLFGDRIQSLNMVLAHSNDMMEVVLGSLDMPLQVLGIKVPLPGRPRPLTPLEAELVAALPAVRSVLSGPCLQYWLGRRLLVAELRAAGTARCHGLPDPSLLVAAHGAMFATVDGELCLRARLHQAATAWDIIASTQLDLPEALAVAAGEAAGGDGADGGAVMAATPAAAVARRRQPPPWRAAGDGMPYTAAHVYDLAHGALAAALRVGTDPANFLLLRPTVLLVWLTLERLRPAVAAARLPGLWRVVLSYLRSVDAAEVLLPGHDVHPSLHTLVLLLGRLLRLELQEGTSPPGQAETAGAAAAAAPAPGCSFSLRCALEAGFLPAVEQLLRRLAALPDGRGAELFLYTVNCLLRDSGVWPAVLAHGSVCEVTSFILTLRKATRATSGVYLDPTRAAEDEDLRISLAALQAEGPRLSSVYVAALLEQMLTVLQIARAIGEPEAGSTRSGGARSGGAGSSGAEIGNAASSGAGSGAADSGSTSSRGTGSEGAGSGDLSGGGGGNGDSVPSHLALNYALGAGRFAGHGWLVQAGGRPTYGSPAGEQQRMLASFALAQWLPVVDPLRSPLVERIYGGCLTWVERQCLGARLRVSHAAATPGSVADGVEHQEWLALFLETFDTVDRRVSLLRDILSSPPGPGAAKMWHTFLQQVMLVVAVVPVERALQIARQIIGCCAAEADDGTAPCSRSQSPHGTELAVRAWAAAAAAAAAAAEPPVGAAADAAAAAEQPAGAGDSAADACAGASTHATGPPPSEGDSITRARWLRLLLQPDCGRLVGVLDAALPLLAPAAGVTREAATEAGAGRGLAEGDAAGASGITGGAQGTATDRPFSGGTVDHCLRGDTVSAARSVFSARLDELALGLLEGINGSSETPVELPSPAAALRAAKEAGLVPCGNPGCANLEGPSEAALPCRKTCSRCRAVSYCSGACQLAHWLTGHREGCPGSAAPSGSGR